MSEKAQKSITLLVGVLAMSLTIGYIVLAWVEPSQSPPGDNVPAPINVGSESQGKLGSIVIGSQDTGLLGGHTGIAISGNTNDKIRLYGTQAAPHTIWLGNDRGVRFWDNTNGELMRITNTGDVSWIGTLTGGSVPWARLTSFPSACPSGQYVTAVGSSLTCSTPPGGVGGSGTTNYLAKWTAETTLGNSIIYDNGTNVGIGTSIPGYKLDVQGGDINVSGVYRRGGVAGASITCGAGNTPSGITISGGIVTSAGSCTPIGAGISWPLLAPDGSAAAPDYSFSANSNMGMFRAGANILAFSTAGTERLRIDGSGNVGIGTTSPEAKLDISNTTTARGLRVTTNYSTAYNYGVISSASGGTSQNRGGQFSASGGSMLNIGVYTSASGGTHNYGIYSLADKNYFSGNVGIGTTDPRTRLELGDDGAILAIGTYNSGWTEPDLGSGTRLLWYPRKAAFRAGRVTGTQWNDANIGPYSTAMGYNTTASGRSSTAIGYGTTASGWYSTAMGLETTASGWYSTAMGVRTTASGFYSTAMGRGIRAEGEYSVAIALNDQTGTAVSQHNTMSIMGGNVGIGTTDPGTNRLKVDGNTEITGNLNVGGTSTLKPPYAVQNSSSSWSVPESAPAARVYHPDPHATTNITIPTGTSMRLIIFVSGRIAYNAHTWGDYYVDVDNNSALVPACFRGHENVSTSGYQTDFSAICMTNTLGSGSHTIRVKWFDSNTRAGIATITHRNITVMAILP